MKRINLEDLRTVKRIRNGLLVALLVCITLAYLSALLGVTWAIGVFTVLFIGGFIAFCIIDFCFWKCPHCGGDLGRFYGKYCQHCGKKLDL